MSGPWRDARRAAAAPAAGAPSRRGGRRAERGSFVMLVAVLGLLVMAFWTVAYRATHDALATERSLARAERHAAFVDEGLRLAVAALGEGDRDRGRRGRDADDDEGRDRGRRGHDADDGDDDAEPELPPDGHRCLWWVEAEHEQGWIVATYERELDGSWTVSVAPADEGDQDRLPHGRAGW